MARKRYSDEDVLKLLREIELTLTAGDDVPSACSRVGINDATYYNWRKRFGGMGRWQLSEMKSLEKENVRLKKTVADTTSLRDFAEPATLYIADKNAVHPFREEDGRCQLTLLDIMMQVAGLEMIENNIDEDEFLSAMIASFVGDEGPLRSTIIKMTG